MRWTKGTGVAGVSFATAAGAAGIVAVYFGGGCASVLGVVSDRYLVDAGDGDTGVATTDGGVDGGDFPPGWACLGLPVPTAPPNVQLKLQFTDVTNASGGNPGAPIPGADVHACARLDTGCATPFSDTTTDDAGIATLTGLTGGFVGYFEVHASNFTPAILSRPPLLVSESAQQGMANLSLLSAGASLAGVTQDPNLSIAIVSALDCTSAVSEGIVFFVGSPGPGEQVVYLSNDLPSKSATQTDSSSGSALVFNVPSGTLSITAAFATSGTPIRTVTSLARSGWVSFVLVAPDQATHPPI